MVYAGRRGRVAGCEFSLGVTLDKGEGVAAPDTPAAAGWYRLAADTGHAGAASNLCRLYTLGRGWAWQVLAATSFHIVDPRFLS